MIRLTIPAAVLSAALLGAVAAQAQTAGQLVEPSYAPPVVRAPGGGLTLPASTGLAAPAGAENLFVTPSGLQVEGGLPPLADETAKIEAGFANRRVSAADLFAAANALEEAYVRAGYPLIRVSLPPQTIADGEALKLVVTEGYVESVDSAALPENVRKRVDTVMAPLIDQRNPTGAEIERRLLLAGDTPGLEMTSTLKAGGKPGATALELAGRYDPVTGYLGVDNSLSEALGRYTISAGVNFNDLLGLGEVGYLRLGGWPGFDDDGLFADDPRNRQLVAGFTVPLGADGWWVNIEGVDSRTVSDNGLPYTLPDHYQRFSANLGYDWLRSRSVNATLTVSFDAVEENQTFVSPSLTAPFTLDRLRVLRITQSADGYLEGGTRLSGAATLSVGLDGLGAYQPTASLPMSRDGAEPDFQKLKVDGALQQPLGDFLSLSLAVTAQTSFGAPLPSSEQFGLGGANWLSAFTTSDIEADTGAAMRAELALPKAFHPFENRSGTALTLSPYVFAAGGVAKLEQPTVFEEATTRAGAFGVGLRLAAFENRTPYSATLSLEYAHGTRSAGDDTDRFNLAFMTRF